MFAEIQQQGYKGSYDTVASYTRRIRTVQGIKPRKRHLVKSLPKVTQPKKLCLTPRRAVWLVLRKPESQQPEDKELRLMNNKTIFPKAIAIYNNNIIIFNVTRIKRMDSTKLSDTTIELSDITAWDKNGNKLLVSKVRARDIVEDITAKIENILKFEYEHNRVIIPYAMTATREEIKIFQWDGETLENVYTFPTHEVLSEYDLEFSKKRIFEYYLETLVEGWLRDLAYHWKTENPPKLQELQHIGFVENLADAAQ